MNRGCRKIHNQRRPTTTVMAIEHAPRPLAWSSRQVTDEQKVMRCKKLRVQLQVSSGLVELCPFRDNNHIHCRYLSCTSATPEMLCNILN
jgi:hypothetical protein